MYILVVKNIDLLAVVMLSVNLVAVGSKNPAKVKAVEKVLVNLGINARVLSTSCKTSVGPQPIGLKKIILGAFER